MSSKKRPRVILNVAMSADGKIDTVARRGATISSLEDKARVDRLRASVDAVLVGGRTLVREDPKLTIKSPDLRRRRKAEGRPENPAKIGVVSVADLKPAGAFLTAGPARKLIFTTRRTLPEQIQKLELAGAEVFVAGEKAVNLNEILHSLSEMGIRTLMVEGGGTLIAEFLRLKLADELYAYIAPRLFAGGTAPTLADGPGFMLEQAPRLMLVSVERFDPAGGVLLHYRIRHNP
jgi:2,5-diamino-6-(ribosylamino)-4(3H)-pyrimidinone 5'-phosphate reductase